MTESMRWIKHKGSTVVIADYSGMMGMSFVEEINSNLNRILEYGYRPGKMISVNVFRDSCIDKAVLESFKNLAKVLGPLAGKSAVVGAEGVQLFFLDLVISATKIKVKTFDTEAEALDWVVEKP